ncbi:MAG: outer rane biosis protein BamB [Planctomycetaceae bacterium]|nr:outer rane biosis protein BamB [Planctomycetaceae bacterium]
MPERLSTEPKVVWKSAVASDGLAGIAATADFVFLAGRDLEDKSDVFQCLSAEDGSEVWSVRQEAAGHLDYGNSPRATPLVNGEKIYFQGAFGDLLCVALETGETIWKRNLYADFQAETPTWGACSSPFITGDKLIVNPGAAKASLVALNPASGKVVWQTPGRPSGYGSLIQARLGGVDQIVGHDNESLGGWDVKTGQRLWEVRPSRTGDFNVPTPIAVGERLFVVTENNGSRLFEFEKSGRAKPQPVATNTELSPDTSTPVVVNNLVIGCWLNLFALDLNQNLKSQVNLKGDAFRGHVSLIASDNKVLVIGNRGELALLSVAQNRVTLLSQVRLFPGPVEIYSHPAMVGSRLYVRGTHSVQCIDLS